MNNDISLTFDPAMFTKGVDAMLERMNSIETHLGSIVGSTNKMEKSGAKSIGLWTAIMSKGIGLIGSAMSKILSFVPEVGKSFQIAGDIIGRNLLWPLRHELIPLLRGMLTWVRDHRAMFVQWGMVIANVFRIIKVVVVSFYELTQRIVERLTAGLKKVFGGTVKSISEIINIILFRITVLCITAQSVIEPVLNLFVDSVSALVGLWKSFFEGLSKGFGPIAGTISDITEIFQELIGMVSDIVGSAGMMGNAFKGLGQILGGIVNIALQVLVELLDDVVSGLKEAGAGIKFLQRLRTMSAGESGRLFAEESKEIWSKNQERRMNRVERTGGSFKKMAEGAGNIVGIESDEDKITPGIKGVGSKTVNNTTVNAPITIIDHKGDLKKTSGELSDTLRREMKKQQELRGTYNPK